MSNHPPIARDYEVRLFIILIVTLSLIFFLSFYFSLNGGGSDNSVSSEIAPKLFPDVSIGAKVAYVYDVRNQTVLFARHENNRMPLASLTKVMTALVAEDYSPLYGTITVTSEALEAEGDSGLRNGEEWSLKNLLDFSLMTSSNDGMRAVALSLGALSQANATPEEIINDFVGKMNQKASELGLKNTYFLNETGLDESEIKGGAYGTARDMSVLLEYILARYPDFFSATRETTLTIQSLDNRNHLAKNTNDIVSEIPGLLASKTGFTDTAGGNLIIAFDPEIGRPIIVTILGSTEEGRFADARTLIGATMEYIGQK